MSRPYLRCFVLICVLVGGAVAPFAAPAGAQAETNNSSSNSSSGADDVPREPGADVSDLRPSQVNSSGNGTENNSSGGDGGVVDDVTGAAEGAWNRATPDIPSTQEIANDTAGWAKNNTLNATQWALNKSMALVIGTTHPDNSGPNGIFGTPTNDPYENLYNAVYGPFSFQYSVLILLLLLFAMIAVMPYAGLASGGTYRITQTTARILGALLLIMFWWPIGSMLTQMFDALAMSIAPSAEELTSSMGGMFKLSAGPILAVLAFYFVGFVEVLSLGFIYAFRQAALIVFQFAMPLLLVFAYAGPHRRVRSIASTISWQYFSLLVMAVPTAFLMRVGFEAEWGFGLGIIGNLIVSMSLLGLALAVPVVFSIAAFRAPPAIKGLASGAAGAAATQGSKAWERQNWIGSGGEEEEDGQTTTYVEDTSPDERMAATDGGTNYSEATARGPGPAPGGALPGSGGSESTASRSTAEKIRDFEQRMRGQSGGSAAEQTQHYNQRDVIDVESTVVDEGDSS